MNKAMFPPRFLLISLLAATPLLADEVEYVPTGAETYWQSVSNWLPQVVPALKNQPASHSVVFENLLAGNQTLRFDGGAGTYSVIDFSYNHSSSILIRNAGLSEGVASTILLNVTGDLTKKGSGNLRFHTAANGSIAVKVEGDLVIDAGTVQVGSSFAVAQNFTVAGNTIINAGMLGLRLTERGTTEAPILLGNVEVKTDAALQLWDGANNSTAIQYFRLTGLKGGGEVYANNLPESGQRYYGHLEINTSSEDNVFSGKLSEKGGQATLSVTKTGEGSLTLAGGNSYSGATAIKEGRLIIAHDQALGTSIATVNSGVLVVDDDVTVNNELRIDGGALVVNGTVSGGNAAVIFGASGGQLTGNGTVDAGVELDNVNRMLSPGEGIGVLTFDEDQAWTALTYEWDISSWLADSADEGYDQISILGGLDLDGATEVRLMVTTLFPDGQEGALADFSEVSKSWSILTVTSDIAYFDPSKWEIDTARFQNAFEGEWSLSLSGNDLVLNYAAIPEASSVVFVLIGGGMVMLRVRGKKSLYA